MNLFEYIKSQLPQMPNVVIMKQLGASEKLIEYVKKTTWNTNLGMMETLGCEDEPAPSGEVWAYIAGKKINMSIKTDSISETGTTTKTYADWRELLDNHQDYEVSARFIFSSLPEYKIEVPWDEDNLFHVFKNEDLLLVEVTIDGKEPDLVQVQAGGGYNGEKLFSRIEIIVTKK